MNDETTTALVELLRAGWYVEHGQVGTLPRGPRYQVCDLQGNIHGEGVDKDTAIYKALSNFERHMAWEQAQHELPVTHVEKLRHVKHPILPTER